MAGSSSSGDEGSALLGLLLLHANEAVSRDRLIDDGTATASGDGIRGDQVYVSQLRKLVGRDVIVTQPPGYLIRVPEGTLDLERFEEAGIVPETPLRMRPPTCSGRHSACGVGHLWPSSTSRSRARNAPGSKSSG